jgi:radical SAM superfamily enzyme YgiQ (UPF0313 family)
VQVLLINSNLRNDVFSAPPVGICYVAQAAETNGHDVRVLDLCFRRNLGKAIEDAIRDFSPDVVGVSLRNIDNVNMLHPVSYLKDASEIVGIVRRLTDAPLVLGGSGASLLPAEVRDLLGADYIVVADGEEPFVQLLAALEKGEPADAIPGVGFMKDGSFHLSRPRRNDFHRGNPDLGKWIDMRPYQKLGSSYNIQSRRGCRRHCVYCTYGQVLEGSRIRMRSPEDVVDEIEEALFKYEPESFEFVDSIFNDPVDHCVAILEEIVRRPWNARFTTMGMSPLGLDKELLALMWRAGFRWFWISPESASETMMENYGKGFTIHDLVQAAEAINRTRFTVLWCFLVGGPGETHETLAESLDFTLKYLKRTTRPPLHLASFYFGIRVYPGTRLWDIALRDGFISETSDPLDQLWYLSEGLDLELAIKQFKTAMFGCGEISMGYQEMFMDLSKVLAFVGRVFRLQKPYWPTIVRINDLFYKLGLHHVIPLPDLAGLIRSRLARQGYSGRHLTPFRK